MVPPVTQLYCKRWSLGKPFSDLGLSRRGTQPFEWEPWTARGTTRHLHALGYCVVSELPLPLGRRADLVALGGDGEILIVEIKSSIADFRADQKWMDYRLHCDRLFFATIGDVPCEIFPRDAGLIVADAFGASIVCEAPEHRLKAARRKTVMLRFAHAAALRLQALADPHGPYGGEG